MTALDTIKQAVLGVPFDPGKQPSRQGVVKAFAEMQTQLEAAQSGAFVRDTRANLNALLAAPVSAMAWVVNDPTQANNGIYENTGSNVAAIWTRRTDIPQFVISAMNTGEGNANLIKAITDRAIPIQDGRALILVNIVEENTDKVEIIFNGSSSLRILSSDGSELVEDSLKSGMIVAGYITGNNTKFQLISQLMSEDILNAIEECKTLALQAQSYANLANQYLNEVQQQLNNILPVLKTFAGDGVTATFDLDRENLNELFTEVFVNGLYIYKGDYSISTDGIITFAQIPPNASKIEVVIAGNYAIAVAIPNDNTIDAFKLSNKFFPSYQTVADAETVIIPATTKIAFLGGVSVAGDGISGFFKRVDSAPDVNGLLRFRSVDRYISNGTIDNTNGGWWVYSLQKGEAITPFMFGAKGDRITNDGPAFNRMFAYIRALTVAANQEFNIQFNISLEGGMFLTTESINATGITAWSLAIRNGKFIGKCTGKAILDLAGSRGYTLDHISFYGDKDAMPSCAFMCARTTVNGFCDNQSFREVSTTGWFGITAVYVYAHETAFHDHCTYFNFNHDAYVVILEGYDAHAMTSDFATLLTGGRSFINNQFYADVRYLPVTANISSVTAVVGGTNAVFTVAPGHAWQTGDKIVFSGLGGMPQLGRVIGTILSVAGNNITTDVNTSGLGTYTSGGNMIRAQTKSSVYLARAEEMDMRGSYIVGYGKPQMTLAFPETSFARMERLVLPSLYEGAGILSNIAIDGGNTGATKRIFGMELKTYNSNAYTQLIENIGNDIVDITGADITFIDPIYQPKLALPLAKFALRDADIIFTRLTDIGTMAVAQLGYSAFNGKVHTLNDGITHLINMSYDTHLIQSIPVILSSGSGAPASYSGTIEVTRIGKRVFVSGKAIVVATLAPASGSALYVTLPYTPDGAPAYGNGRNSTTGAILSVEWLTGYGTSARIRTVSNSAPVTADGQQIDFSFSYLTT